MMDNEACFEASVRALFQTLDELGPDPVGLGFDSMCKFRYIAANGSEAQREYESDANSAKYSGYAQWRRIQLRGLANVAKLSAIYFNPTLVKIAEELLETSAVLQREETISVAQHLQRIAQPDGLPD